MQDEAAFSHYRTQAMVLAYYNALAAGDTDVDVAVNAIKVITKRYDYANRFD